MIHLDEPSPVADAIRRIHAPVHNGSGAYAAIVTLPVTNWPSRLNSMAIMTYKEALVVRNRARIVLQHADNWDDKKLAMKDFQSASIQLHDTFVQQSDEIERLMKLGNTEEQISTVLDVPVFFVNRALAKSMSSARTVMDCPAIGEPKVEMSPGA
jgi:hypothetical protein